MVLGGGQGSSGPGVATQLSQALLYLKGSNPLTESSTAFGAGVGTGVPESELYSTTEFTQ